MRDGPVSCTAHWCLWPLLMLVSGGQAMAACATFAHPLNAVAPASMPAVSDEASQLLLDLDFVPGETRLTRASRQALQVLIDCAKGSGLPEDGLLVVGYAAPAEIGQAAVMALAHDRADAVARQLRRAGLIPADIRAAPSSDSGEKDSFARVELRLRR